MMLRVCANGLSFPEGYNELAYRIRLLEALYAELGAEAKAFFATMKRLVCTRRLVVPAFEYVFNNVDPRNKSTAKPTGYPKLSADTLWKLLTRRYGDRTIADRWHPPREPR